MANYIITRSDGVSTITVTEATINNDTDVPLVGQNAVAYGDDWATAFVRLLENFAHTSPPTFGGPSNRLTGQIWFDKTNNELKVWDGGAWVAQLRTDAALAVGGDIIPTTGGVGVDSTYDVGSASFRWAEIHGDDLIAGTSVAGPTITASSSLVSSGSTSLIGATTTTASTGDITTGADTKLTIGLGDGARDLAAFRITPSTVPGTLSNGDIWVTSSGVFARVNGATRQLDVASGAVVNDFIGRTGSVVAVATDYASFYPRKDAVAGTDTIDAARTWNYNNRPAFNGGTSGSTSPFTVDSTQVVTNLNADLVDGIHGTALALDANVVHTTGAEGIAGAKTFTDIVRADAGATTGQGFRVIGTSTNSSTNAAHIELYLSDDSTRQARFGTLNGSSAVQVWSGLGDLTLFASNNQILNLNTTESLLTQGGSVNTMRWHLANVSGITTTASVYDNGAARRSVGFNETPAVTVSGTYLANTNDIGKYLTRTGTTAASVRVDELSHIPIGASFIVNNDNASNTLTITTGTGVTLEWVDGSGSAPPTGTRTLAYNSVATIRKKSATVYQIWGNGIS